MAGCTLLGKGTNLDEPCSSTLNICFREPRLTTEQQCGSNVTYLFIAYKSSWLLPTRLTSLSGYNILNPLHLFSRWSTIGYGITKHVGAKHKWGYGGVPPLYGASGDGWPEFLPLYVWLPDMPFLLASDSDRWEWSVSSLSESVSWEPCGLQAFIAWRVCFCHCFCFLQCVLCDVDTCCSCGQPRYSLISI